MAKAVLFLLVALCLTEAAFSKNALKQLMNLLQKYAIDSDECVIGQPHITYNAYFGSITKGTPGWTVSVVAKTSCTNSNLRLVLSDGKTIAPSFFNQYTNDEKSYQGWAYFFQIPLASTAATWQVVCGQGSNPTKLGPFKLPTNKPTRGFKPSKWAIVADMDASEYSKSTFDRLELIAGKGYDGVLHNGDFAYNVHTSKGRVGDAYFESFSKISSRLPYIISPGNHERFDHFKMFNYRFQMPGAGNGLQTNQAANYFSYILNGVYFVTINWDYVFEEGENRMNEVTSWLSNDLKRQSGNKEIKYRVFFSHKPFYCTMAEPDCIQYYLFKPVESLLYKYKFDLILNSHVHLYYRHKQTDKNFNIVKTNSSLPVFFISGHQGVDPLSGGNTLMVKGNRKGRLEAASAAGLPNYLTVEFKADSIGVTLRDCVTDSVVDSLVINKSPLQKS
jgi:hypothetical protein